MDVLERLASGTWGLREVKSGSGPKDHYLDDIAIQTYVLGGAGLVISSIELIHVNTKYVREPSIDWIDFFIRRDVSEAVAARLADLPARLPALRDSLGMIGLPAAEPGSHCGSPYACEFWNQCTSNKPADWIGYFPRLSQARASELKAHGVETISAIPVEFPLTSKQTIIRDATTSGTPYIAAELGRLLGTFGPPACYLDFEAMMPPIPLYEGTRPYQTIPFQWSLHTIDSVAAKHGRRQANYVMAVISVAFEHGKEHGIVSENPVKGVKRVKRARDAKSANRPWSLDECRTVISSLPAQLRLPVALGMFTGLRKGDVLTLTKAAIKDGKLWRKTNKTGQEVSIPVHPDLARLAGNRTKARRNHDSGHDQGHPLDRERLQFLVHQSNGCVETRWKGRRWPHISRPTAHGRDFAGRSRE